MKTILLLFLTAGVAILCLGWTWSNFAFSSPVFAFLVNWIVMSWVAISGQIAPFHRLPEAYYAKKSFEKTGRIYELVGIRLFKSIVRCPPFTLLSPTLKFPPEKMAASLQILATEMKKAETGHLFIFWLVFAFALYVLLTLQIQGALWLLLFNALFNGYPIILQRYNRIKLQGLVSLLAYSIVLTIASRISIST